MKKKIILNLVLLLVLLLLEFEFIDFGGKTVRISYGKNKNIVSIGTMENGKREGYWLLFYDSGYLKGTGQYKNDMRNGVWIRFREDSLNEVLSLSSFLNNEVDKYEYYFENGKVLEKLGVTNGRVGYRLYFDYKNLMILTEIDGYASLPSGEDEIKEEVSTYEEINPKNIFIKRILIALLILVNVFFLIAHWRKPLHSSHLEK